MENKRILLLLLQASTKYACAYFRIFCETVHIMPYYGILSEKGNIGIEPAYDSNTLKKMRTKHSCYGQNAFRNAFYG